MPSSATSTGCWAAAELDADQVRQVLDFMRQVNGVLDVIDFQRDEPDAEVARLVEARDEARRAKDFPKADALRNELLSMGIVLTDSPTGTTWKRKGGSC